MMAGTLWLLVMVRPKEHATFPDVAALAANGTPPGFPGLWQWNVEDADLGDEECKALPQTPPNEFGLWLLLWAWEEAPSQYEEESTTVRYADECEWRRPTLQQLVMFGVLPAQDGAA